MVGLAGNHPCQWLALLATTLKKLTAVNVITGDIACQVPFGTMAGVPAEVKTVLVQMNRYRG
jgi:hypothetical protein